MWITAGAFVILLAAALVLASQTFERTAIVRGVLQAEGGEARVFVLQPGALEAIHVREGEIVRKGQPLFTIVNDPATDDGGLTDRLLTGYNDQEAILRSRIASIESGGAQRRAEMAAAELEFASQLETARGSLADLRERQRMAQEDLDIALPIAERGFISRMAIRQRESTLLAARQAVGEAEGRVEALRARLAQQRAISGRLPHSLAEEQSLVSESLTAVEQRRVQLKVGARQHVVAPISGRVSAMQASLGETVRPQHPLLSIVPDSAEMLAILYVPSRSIGFIRPGQKMRIRYHAFPYQRFGAAMAVVRHVSTTVLRPDEIDGSVVPEEPVYRVTAELASQHVEGYGERHPIFQGMAFDADIVLEERSFIEWITEPLRARGVL